MFLPVKLHPLVGRDPYDHTQKRNLVALGAWSRAIETCVCDTWDQRVVGWIDVVVAGLRRAGSDGTPKDFRHNCVMSVYRIRITANEMTLVSRKHGIPAVEACPINAAFQHLGYPLLIELASAIKKLMMFMGT